MPQLAETLIQSQYSTWIEIRLDRLKNNLKALKEKAGANCQIMAVVKANAYGHGLSEIAKTLAPEVSHLGVSSVYEALEIKERHIETPILIFGRPMSHEITAALTDGIAFSVSSLEEAKEISDLSSTLRRKTPVHVKVDTGMGRLGIPFNQAMKVIEKMTELEWIQLEGIYTHFPTGEKADGYSDRQLKDFAFLIRALQDKGITFKYRHAANSSGIVQTHHEILNLARPGIMLYGLYPDLSLKNLILISPILSLKSRIISVKRLKTGDSVGYGRQFVAESNSTVAILPIGYSHGYPVAASNKAQVLYKGKRYALAGRVSMDYVAVNLGDTMARPGEEITLIGEDHGEKISTEELADWAQTIPYEIVTRLLPSLPRLYR